MEHLPLDSIASQIMPEEWELGLRDGVEHRRLIAPPAGVRPTRRRTEATPPSLLVEGVAWSSRVVLLLLLRPALLVEGVAWSITVVQVLLLLSPALLVEGVP